MGVLNVTPDSFSDGGCFLDPGKAAEQALRMTEEGADIIDIGGESSRPGAKSVSAKEEIDRVMPVIRKLRKTLDVSLSIDTCKSEVASEALEEGVSIVNDITALRGDPGMARTIARFDAGAIFMHMRGTPGTMQDSPGYDDVVSEIIAYLSGSIELAVRAGIDEKKIIIDPGIGFGKKLEHNLAIINNLRRLEELKKPILVGTSRKSFIGELTGKETGGRIYGTAASVVLAVMNGAEMIRVHDVDAMKDVVRVVDAVRKA
jgi:dihydropteroate synthase